MYGYQAKKGVPRGMEELIECSCCGEKKSPENFEKNRKQCRDCRNIVRCEWKALNADKIARQNRRYKELHPEKIKEWRAKYRKAHPEQVKARNKRYLAKKRGEKPPRDVVDKSSDEYKQMVALRGKEWKRNNPDRLKIYNKRQWEKRKGDHKYRLHHRVSNLVRLSLDGVKGGISWEKLVGYNIEKLKKHLEKNFTPGMSWDNMGEWHIDHKIPVSAFNFSTPNDIDFKKCWALKNLQPLWGPDNVAKGAKLFKPHQPALISGL